MFVTTIQSVSFSFSGSTSLLLKLKAKFSIDLYCIILYRIHRLLLLVVVVVQSCSSESKDTYSICLLGNSEHCIEFKEQN